MIAAVDPFDTVAQDPDAVRADACDLVAPDAVCRPREPIVTEPAGGSSIFSGLVLVLFLALVALLVVLIARAIVLRTPSRRRVRASGDADVDPAVERLPRTIVDHRRTPAEWRSEAEAHRAAGRYRDALRCRYRALVGDLARRDVIDEIPGRTTGEERRQMVTAAPARSDAFGAAADLFDGAWYGHVDVDDADVARMIELESDVLGGVGAHR